MADTMTEVPRVLDAPVVATPPRSGRRSRPQLGIVVALGWLGSITVAAALAQLLPIHDPNDTDFDSLASGPSSEHWLGTDAIGRDIFSRVIHGARVSLVVGALSVAIALAVGGSLGLMAGYFRRRVDGTVTVVADALLALPGLVLLLAVTAAMGTHLHTIILALGVLSIPAFVRLSRASTMQYATRDFVLAAEALGARRRRIVARELLPNVAPGIGAYALIIVSVVIVAEGSLSFLGFGLPPPSVSWGSMIASGRERLGESPHIAGFPALVMFVTVLSLNLLGDRYRSRIDVRESKL